MGWKKQPKFSSLFFPLDFPGILSCEKTIYILDNPPFSRNHSGKDNNYEPLLKVKVLSGKHMFDSDSTKGNFPKCKIVNAI